MNGNRVNATYEDISKCGLEECSFEVLDGADHACCPFRWGRDCKNEEKMPCKALNSGVTGSMVGGALVGQSKISAEIRECLSLRWTWIDRLLMYGRIVMNCLANL